MNSTTRVYHGDMAGASPAALKGYISKCHHLKFVFCYPLSQDYQSVLGKISFTCDLWTNLNLVPFMAVTAHWIKIKKIPVPETGEIKYSLFLQADLIGFHCVPGHHDGEHLAHAFLHILNRLWIAIKVPYTLFWH